MSYKEFTADVDLLLSIVNRCGGNAGEEALARLVNVLDRQPIQRRIKYYRGHRVWATSAYPAYACEIRHGYGIEHDRCDVGSGATPDEALEAVVQEVLKVRGEA